MIMSVYDRTESSWALPPDPALVNASNCPLFTRCRGSSFRPRSGATRLPDLPMIVRAFLFTALRRGASERMLQQPTKHLLVVAQVATSNFPLTDLQVLPSGRPTVPASPKGPRRSPN